MITDGIKNSTFSSAELSKKKSTFGASKEVRQSDQRHLTCLEMSALTEYQHGRPAMSRKLELRTQGTVGEQGEQSQYLSVELFYGLSWKHLEKQSHSPYEKKLGKKGICIYEVDSGQYLFFLLDCLSHMTVT